MFTRFAEDYRSVRRHDPSISKGLKGCAEILFCTPGFLAVTIHRLIHFLHVRCRIPVLPRFLSLIVRWWTGIEIHPGAVLGQGVFIDHGFGVVIGETAEIGENVVICQGVTLGATGNEKTWKRHPSVGSNVIIGSGAKILGPITIGEGAKIGAGSIVLDNILPFSTVVGEKAAIVRVNGQKVNRKTEWYGLSHEQILFRIHRLEKEFELLGKRHNTLENEKNEEEMDYAI